MENDEQHAVERQFHESEERFRLLVDAVWDYAIFMINPDGTIASWNAGAERLNRYTAVEAIGQHFSILYSEDDRLRGSPQDELRRVAERDRDEGEGWLLRKDGTRFWASFTITALRHPDGRLRGFAKVVHDSTERTRLVERFRLAIEASPTGMMMADRSGRIVLVNSQIEKLFGYSREELTGELVEVLVPERSRGGHPELRDGFSRDPQSRPMGVGRDLYGRRKDGTEVPIEIGLNPIETPEGLFVLSSIVDITERKRAETRYRALFDDSPIAILEQDFTGTAAYFDALRASGIRNVREHLESNPDAVRTAAATPKVLTINQAALATFEADDEAQLRERLPDVLASDDFRLFRDQLFCLLDGDTFFAGETRIRTLKGQQKSISLRLSVSPGQESWARVIVSVSDITAHTEAERQLRIALREKEVFLKEIHHRIKNNLQVISSLLNLQAQHLQDPRGRGMLEESRGRVQSIALIHEKLHQSHDVRYVDFDEYARGLVANIFSSLNATARGISSRIDITGVRLPVDVAISCGLLLNELVTNSLKHAFPESRTGSIHVTMRPCDATRLELLVGDDGIGLPTHLKPRQTSSLGLDLVFTFAEQLQAQAEVLRGWQGVSFSFKFAPDGS